METLLDLEEVATSAVSRRAPSASGTDRWPFREQVFAELDPLLEPIVVVGSGPVGMRTVRELCRRAPDRHIIWYGAERGTPYDRVQLTSLLAGSADVADITDDYASAAYGKVERRFGCPITQIDRHARLVIDRRNRFQPYSKLILATGSAPRVPDCIDTRLPGVFTLHRLKDAKAVAEWRQHSRCTVVLGGGMLGLETARAMLAGATKVVIIEQGPRLLSRQLDEAGSALVKRYLESLGIDVLLNVEVQQVFGDTQLRGLALGDRALPCDTLILATGTEPNVELARLAGLNVNRGIEIDDRTVTSDPNIHAVGECAEHRGVLYGTIDPGLEQASVAAAISAGTIARYTGSVPITRLKVLDMPVFSMGHEQVTSLRGVRSWTYRSPDGNRHARLYTRAGRIVATCATGHGVDVEGLQQAVAGQMRLGMLGLLRFLFTGSARCKQARQARPARPATRRARGGCTMYVATARAGSPVSISTTRFSSPLLPVWSGTPVPAATAAEDPASSARVSAGRQSADCRRTAPPARSAGRARTAVAALLFLGLVAPRRASNAALPAAPTYAYSSPAV